MAEIRKVGILQSDVIKGVHLVQFDIETVNGETEVAFLAVRDEDVQVLAKALSLLYPFEEAGSSERIFKMINKDNEETKGV